MQEDLSVASDHIHSLVAEEPAEENRLTEEQAADKPAQAHNPADTDTAAVADTDAPADIDSADLAEDTASIADKRAAAGKMVVAARMDLIHNSSQDQILFRVVRDTLSNDRNDGTCRNRWQLFRQKTNRDESGSRRKRAE